MLYQELQDRGLGELYAYVMKHNTGKKNPYHNNFHIEHMTLFTLKGCDFFRGDKTGNESFPVINDRAIVLMLIASLVHDLHHTGDGKDDDVNIALAKKGFLNFLSETMDYINMWEGHVFDLTNEDFDVIFSLIDATRYPYIIPNEELDLMQKIIRDADVVQGIFVQNYINGVVEPLSKEIGIPFESLLNGQEAFYKDFNFATEWAINMRDNALPYIVETVNAVKKLLNN